MKNPLPHLKLKKLTLAIKMFFIYQNAYLYILFRLGIYNSEYTTYKLWNGLKYKCRTDSLDIAILNESFIYKEYINPQFSKLNNTSIVYDLGAQIGDFSILTAYKTNATVFAFEPEIDNYNLLVENIKINKLEDKVFPIQKAVTNKSGKLKFYVSEGENKGVHSSHYEDNSNGREIEVESIALIDTLKYAKDIKISLLKIDIEGGEFEIINKFNRTFFDNVESIVLEYHCLPHVKNRTSRNDLISILEDMGFASKVYSGDESMGIIHAQKS